MSEKVLRLTGDPSTCSFATVYSCVNPHFSRIRWILRPNCSAPSNFVIGIFPLAYNYSQLY